MNMIAIPAITGVEKWYVMQGLGLQENQREPLTKKCPQYWSPTFLPTLAQLSQFDSLIDSEDGAGTCSLGDNIHRCENFKFQDPIACLMEFGSHC
jgi:hypothetical protein